MIQVKRLSFQAEQPEWPDIEQALSRQPGIRLYALIDGALNDGFLPRLAKHWPVEEWRSIYAQMPEGNAPEVSPLLLPIDSQHNPSARSIFKRLLMPQIIQPETLLLIWSEAPIDILAEHLGQHAEIKTAEDKRALLRFHDPNVWPAALAVQTEKEQAIFYSKFTEIWLPDLDNIWWSYRHEGSVQKEAFTPHRWDEARHRQFMKLTAPRKILSRLENEYPEKITGSREGWLKRIREWVEAAATLKVESFGEYQLYSVTALFVGDDFAQVAEVAGELQEIGKRHANLSQAIQAVPASVWDRLEAAQA